MTTEVGGWRGRCVVGALPRRGGGRAEAVTSVIVTAVTLGCRRADIGIRACVGAALGPAWVDVARGLYAALGCAGAGAGDDNLQVPGRPRAARALCACDRVAVLVAGSLVARGTCVLAEFTTTSGNFTTITRRILEKIPRADTSMSYVYDRCAMHDHAQSRAPGSSS